MQKRSKPHWTIYSRRSKPITSCIEMDRAENERDLSRLREEEFRSAFWERKYFGLNRAQQTSTRSETKPTSNEVFWIELAEFFSILLRGLRPSVEKAHNKTSGCHTCRKHRADYPTRREPIPLGSRRRSSRLRFGIWDSGPSHSSSDERVEPLLKRMVVFLSLMIPYFPATRSYQFHFHTGARPRQYENREVYPGLIDLCGRSRFVHMAIKT